MSSRTEVGSELSDHGTTSDSTGRGDPRDLLGPAPDADAYFAYSPIIDRPPVRWPNKARVAFWVAPNIELYEFRPPSNPYRTFYRRMPAPDVALYSYLDFANRVGFWRMLEVFDRYQLPVTASVNTAVFDHFPEVCEAMAARDWDYMSHGAYNTRFMFGMDETEEIAFVRDSVDAVERATGKRLRGFFGPAASLNERTMRILAESGFTYSCDWHIDDQPVPLKVGADAPLLSMPYGWELNDGLLISYLSGRFEADYFVQICKDQFDRLYEEGRESGRVMCVALHPMCFGQPHRIKYLDELLTYVLSHTDVWAATADQIADHYLEHHYAEVVSHLENREGVRP